MNGLTINDLMDDLRTEAAQRLWLAALGLQVASIDETSVQNITRRLSLKLVFPTRRQDLLDSYRYQLAAMIR